MYLVIPYPYIALTSLVTTSFFSVSVSLLLLCCIHWFIQGSHQQNEKTTYRIGESISNGMINEELIAKIYKQLLQFNIKKPSKPIKKWAEDLNRHFSKKGMQTANSRMKKVSNNARHQGNANHTFKTAVFKEGKNNKCWQGCGEKRSLLHCWWEWKLVLSLQKTV